MAELAEGKIAAGNGKMKCSAEIFIANPPSHPQKIHSPPAPPIPNSSPQNHSILHGFLYSALWLLFALQLFAILKNHSHLGGLTMFDTILLIIVKAEPRKVPLRWIFGAKDSIPPSANLMRPFLFFVGGIVFLALLFVNFTHAMEAISCADSSSHFSDQFVGMVLLNFIAKFPLLFCSFQLSIPDISLQSRLLLHFGPSLVTLALFAANWHFSRADDFLISHLDRYFGAGLCFLLAVAIFPIFRFNLPYLLCDSPEGLDKEDLKMEIEKKFQQIRCQHLHIYCQWPSSKSFNIFAKIQMHLGENEENEFGKIMLELREMLKEKGAQKMSIEPIVTIKGEKMNGGGGNLRLICVNKNCQMKERTCCNGQNEGGIKGEIA